MTAPRGRAVGEAGRAETAGDGRCGLGAEGSGVVEGNVVKEIAVELGCGEAVVRNSWEVGDGGEPAGPAEWSTDGLPGGVRVRLANAGSAISAWDLGVSAETPWQADVTVEVRLTLRPALAPSHVLWPTDRGVYARQDCSTRRDAAFFGAGRATGGPHNGGRLSLPMAVLESPRGNLLVGTDPGYSTTIVLPPGGAGDASLAFGWTWLAAAGVHANETRRLFVEATPDGRDALDRWFELATPEVPRGPAWLHDIALQNYDYLSKDGQGWFADIDAAAELIGPEERHRALFCLHGWYDQVGRYCFDPRSGRLDESWIAFPHVNDPRLSARPFDLGEASRNVVPPTYAFRNLERYRPVRLTWTDLRDRLRYAKDRGFRTAFYAMTGLQAAGDPEPRVADGTGLNARTHLWLGPDLVGPTFLRNPLHPDVRSQTLGYIRAVLEQVGDLTDALVFDEAYYVGFGTLGPPASPGYADRAQFSLVREMADICHRYRSDLAFLTADQLGMPWLDRQAFPYSLAADGIYQDSWCWPSIWDGVRFPTWRNVAWSCNWTPVTSLGLTRWAVLAHGAPVAISNGCWGDDTGLAEMDRPTAHAIADLWRARIGQQHQKPLSVVEALRPGVG